MSGWHTLVKTKNRVRCSGTLSKRVIISAYASEVAGEGFSKDD